ncbi:MAG: preprotein translocase subunit YajC [Oscillospiraceae bacterium]|nr:preprotein translocase subunit YajC [Oscillospiraceae bacterium]
MNIFMTLAAAGSGGAGGSTGMIIMMVALFGAMYFFTIRPQKKQQKREQELRDNTQVGDEITTIGGICGKVVAIKDDTVTIETGSDRTKIKFKKFAIGTNITANEKMAAEREAAKATAQSKKEKKTKDSVDDRPKDE